MTDYIRSRIQDAIEHLECIMGQAQPGDSQIVMDHVFGAHKDLVEVRARLYTEATHLSRIRNEAVEIQHSLIQAELRHPHDQMTEHFENRLRAQEDLFKRLHWRDAPS